MNRTFRSERVQEWMGWSTDTKPTGVPPGSTFLELDTQHRFRCVDGRQWVIDLPARELTARKVINLNQAASSYDLFTATTQNCFIDHLGLYVPVDVSGVETFTGISVQSTDTTPVVFIAQASGVKANLTLNAVLTYRGPAVVEATKKIQLTIYGGATGLDCNAIVFVSYRPVVAGGYLLIA